jgi:uncharacterized protein (TIGR02118 family)
MRTVFAAFDFASDDLASEERNYLDNHVRMTKQLPGLRLYLSGRLRALPGEPPPFYRASVLTFDNLDAFEAALRKSAVSHAIVADGRAHMKNLRWREIDSEVVVPFETKRHGMNCFVMVAEFDLKPNGADSLAAEKRYLDHHTHIARCLPGLRHYIIGRLSRPLGAKPELVGCCDRLRMAVLVFDTAEALREAYRSPIGQELVKDEAATITNARVYRFDGTVQA